MLGRHGGGAYASLEALHSGSPLDEKSEKSERIVLQDILRKHLGKNKIGK